MSTSPFSASVVGFRQVKTRVGDTLQKIALRELGNAALWHSLADLNGLQPPYIVNSLAEVQSSAVILAGQPLMVPASAPAPSGVSTTEDPLGTDLIMTQGRLVASATGDFQTVSGKANLTQALNNRLGTPLNDLLFHPEYGNGAFDLIGQGNNPGDALLAQTFVDQSIRSDPRVASVSDVEVSITGDVLSASATATAVTGQQVPTGVPAGTVAPIAGGVA